jgi:hypothetical protein
VGDIKKSIYPAGFAGQSGAFTIEKTVEGYVVVSKFVEINTRGFITGVVHDSGILYLPDGQSYVLIFFSSNLPENQLGAETGAIVSEIIYHVFSQRSAD